MRPVEAVMPRSLNLGGAYDKHTGAVVVADCAVSALLDSGGVCVEACNVNNLFNLSGFGIATVIYTAAAVGDRRTGSKKQVR